MSDEIRIYNEIHVERVRQDDQWGESNHAPDVWALILAKHSGRFAADALDLIAAPGYEDQAPIVAEARQRAIKVAAICVAFVECLERGKWLDGGWQ